MIAARDFCILSAQRELSPEEVRENGFAPAGENARVLVTCSLNDTSKVPQKSFTRGIIHAYGYLVVERPGENKITVACVGCADPSGRIPGWLVDAANVDNCKKMARIRVICEGLEGKSEASAPRVVSAEQPTPKNQDKQKSVESSKSQSRGEDSLRFTSMHM